MKKVITFVADYGKILTDGSKYGTTLNVPEGESVDNIKELTIEECNELIGKDLATKEDYINALRKLGVEI